MDVTNRGREFWAVVRSDWFAKDIDLTGDFAGIDAGDQADNAAAKCGFACAGRTDDGDIFSATDFETDVLNCFYLRAFIWKALVWEFNQRFHVRTSLFFVACFSSA